MSNGESGELGLRIVKGEAEPDEVAAVVAAIARSASRRAEPGDTASLSAWGAYFHRLRRPPRPGRTGWRESALPR
ncbi:MAG TPA: acyl-CoA carboxylase epsilon subunit [Actinopolymorphaceae bacterium]